MIAGIELAEYLIFGIATGFLAVLGDLLTQFLRRCADLHDHDGKARLNSSFTDSALAEIWH